MHAQTYDFTLTPGGVQTIPAVGTYFKILGCSGKVKVVCDTGPQLDCLAGQGLKNKRFGRLTLVNKTASDNVGTILVFDGEMVDDRITGEVSVIDGGRSRVEADQAFIGVASTAAVAGNFPAFQVKNPAASPVNVFVSQLIVSASLACDVLATLGPSWANSLTLVNNAKSKKSGGSDGVSEIRSAVVAGVLGGDPGMLSAKVVAGQALVYRPTEPFLILPGNQLLIQGQTANTAFSVTADLFEQDR